MKFTTAAAFTLAMAAGAQSSLVPLLHPHLAISTPIHVVSAPLHTLHHVHHPGSLAIHASTADLHHGLIAHPGAVVIDAHHAPIAPIVHVAHAHSHAHEGHYIAKTRGAVHKAPLAGHAASAASINLEPAPGTI